jgi:glycosyltransferase involved in cell wall biosynthesis
METLDIATSKRKTLSVVIATLGGKQLVRTINQLNLGTIVPDEIILCVPKSEFHRVQECSAENVRFLQTDIRGQVAQRAYGFQNASGKFVLQLDDDVILESTCVERLLRTIEEYGLSSAVGASLIDNRNFTSVYKRQNLSPIFQNIYCWLLNGGDQMKAGSIIKSGLNIGWDPDNSNFKCFLVEWLAVGCVLHRKENLVLENFYPFPGKAYCEDLMHSHILESRGISLVVDSTARCFIDAPIDFNMNLRLFATGLYFDYRARKFYVKSRCLNLTRMHFYYLLRVLKFLYRFLKN